MSTSGCSRKFSLSPVLLAALTSISCGGGGGGSSGDGPNTDPGPNPGPSPVALATTATCDNISGASAQYWDLNTGIFRPDVPLESTLPPAVPGGTFFHPRLGLTFIFPAGWNATAIIDSFTSANQPVEVIAGNVTVLAGASVLRNDGRALWRLLSTLEANTTSAQQRLNEEIQRVLNGFGITDQPTELCSFAGPGSVGGIPGFTSASYLRTSEFIIQVSVSQTLLPFTISQPNQLATTTVVAPINDFDREILDTYLPISFQLFVGGSSEPECSDGMDNDGDGAVDQNDDDCVTETDISESS